MAVQKSDVNLSSVFNRRGFEKDPWSVSDLIWSLFVEHPVTILSYLIYTLTNRLWILIHLSKHFWIHFLHGIYQVWICIFFDCYSFFVIRVFRTAYLTDRCCHLSLKFPRWTRASTNSSLHVFSSCDKTFTGTTFTINTIIYPSNSFLDFSHLLHAFQGSYFVENPSFERETILYWTSFSL